MYIYGVGSLNDNLNEEVYLPAKLENKGTFTEIMGSEIFNQMENDYFVLLFTGAKKKKDKYYGFINEYTKRNYKFYYVDLNNKENKFLYGPNDLNFTLYGDRLLKVREHEYEFYVDEKNNILREMETHINSIKEEEKLQNEKLKQEQKQKEKEETNTKKEAESKKKTTTKEKNKKEIQKIELDKKTLIK